jgi:hypothetical protein
MYMILVFGRGVGTYARQHDMRATGVVSKAGISAAG